MNTIVLATRNKGKIAEIAALLKRHQPGLTVLGLDAFPEIGDIPETGATFEDNATLKAQAVAKATGLVALADDSGLEVDALDGDPGVRSARYSGEVATDEENNRKLLQALQGLPLERRRARFRCVLVALAPDGRRLKAEGVWEGLVSPKPCGSGGFGYDPLFLDPVLGKTAAELPPEEKNRRSHRGMALRRLAEQWSTFCKANLSPATPGT